MSVTVLTDETLRARRISQPADLAQLVPGLSYTPTHFGTPIFTLRGIGFYDNSLAASPAVSMYVDEVGLPFSAMARGAVFDIARIEVMKGPQGTLFGQNSTGGAINFVTAKPTDQFHAGAYSSFGTDNDLGAEGFVSGPLNDTINARLAFKTNQSGDWQDNYTRDDHIGSTNFNQARLSFEAKPRADLTFYLSLSGWIDKSDTQAPQLIAIAPSVPTALSPIVAAAPLSPNNARAANWNPGKPYRQDNNYGDFQFRAEWQITSDLSLTSLTSFQRFNRDELHNADGMSVENASFGETGRVSSLFQELRLQNRGDEKLRWLVGINYENDNADDRFFVQLSQASNAYILGFHFVNVESFSRQQIETQALFANADWQLTDTLSIDGGLRYTSTSRGFSGCSQDSDGALAAGFNLLQTLMGVAAADRATRGGCVTIDSTLRSRLVVNKLDQDNVSWRAGMKWRPWNDSTLVYANISRGFKIGSFPTLSAVSAAAFLPVRQERLTAYEIGVKADLWDQKAQLSLAGFHYDYSDKQWLGYIIDPIFGRLSALQNIPKSQVNGAEVELHVAPLDGLKLQIAASYTQTQIERGTGINAFFKVIDFKGFSFPFSPQWQIASDAEYRVPVSGIWVGFTGVSLSYRSATMSGFSSDEPLLRIDPYVLVDLRAGIESQNGALRVWLWGKNVTDTYYWTNSVATIDTVIRYAGHPASFGIAASYAL